MGAGTTDLGRCSSVLIKAFPAPSGMDNTGLWVLLAAFLVLVGVLAIAPWAFWFMWYWPATYLIVIGAAVATFFVLRGIQRNRRLGGPPEGEG